MRKEPALWKYELEDTFAYLFWEPGSEEGHLESIGIRVKSVKRVWTHSSHHHLHATRKMIANCKRKEKVHYWLSNTCAITGYTCKHRFLSSLEQGIIYDNEVEVIKTKKHLVQKETALHLLPSDNSMHMYKQRETKFWEISTLSFSQPLSSDTPDRKNWYRMCYMQSPIEAGAY